MTRKTNDKDKKLVTYSKYFLFAITALSTSLICSEAAFAVFDFQPGAALTAGVKPLTDLIADNWGKGIMLGSAGYMIAAEGDMRQKAVKAGIGACAGSAVMMIAIKAFL